MVFEYKGTDYEFPDDMNDDEALRLIKQDLGEDTAQIAQPEPQAQAQEPEKDPAWYDVPGKVSRTLKTTGEKIEREGELAGQGKQSGLAGGLWSMAHAGAGAVRAVGDVVSPIFDNPVSKKLGSEFLSGFGGQMRSSNAQRGITPNAPETRIKPLDTAIESGKKYIEENPEVANRIGSGVDIAALAAPELKAGSMLAKGAKTPLGEGLKGFGSKTIKIRDAAKKSDYDAGYKVENVYKYDLDGPLDKAIKNGQDKITALSSELKSRIQQGADEGARINAIDLIDREIGNVVKKGVGDLDKQATINMLESFKKEVLMSNPDGVIDLADAQTLKRSIGSKGAWYESKWGRQVDPEANSKEKAASGLYNVLKKEIEDKAPEGVKEINKQLSELIPIENTMLKRLYVTERGKMISLNDMVALATAAATGPKGWMLYGGNKILNSPVTGGGAYRLGEALTTGRKRPDAIPEVSKKETVTPEDIPEDFETPTYLRKGRAPLPEQPLESKWADRDKPKYPLSDRSKQLIEDIAKKSNKSDKYAESIEGIDFLNRDAAGDLTQQITEKKRLPITLDMNKKSVTSREDIKKQMIESLSSFIKKEPLDIKEKGSSYTPLNVNDFNEWFANLRPEERTGILSKFGVKKTEKTDALFTQKELSDKQIPSSLMTQLELSKLRWTK